MNGKGKSYVRWVAGIAALALAGPTIAADVPTGASSKPPQSATQKRLDLRIPSITELYTPEQLEAMLGNTRSDGDLEEVEVPGRRVQFTPDVWGGLGAPVWALLNPTQAWRIIAPIPPDRIHAADVRPEAQPPQRDPFRP